MENRTELVDILLTNDDDEPSVALNADDICLQWQDLPNDALRAMRAILTEPSGTCQEVRIGTIFGACLCLVEREGIFSFKATNQNAGPDLMRIDLSSRTIAGILIALDDLI